VIGKPGKKTSNFSLDFFLLSRRSVKPALDQGVPLRRRHARLAPRARVGVEDALLHGLVDLLGGLRGGGGFFVRKRGEREKKREMKRTGEFRRPLAAAAHRRLSLFPLPRLSHRPRFVRFLTSEMSTSTGLMSSSEVGTPRATTALRTWRLKLREN
jgi:hypothetical protein